jgi:NitT/TauT family transport system substrate-binding protein
MLVVLLALIVSLGAAACGAAPDSSDQGPLLVVGTDTGALSSLLYVAQERGFFADADLRVELKPYVSGKACADAALRGDIDVATAAEFVLASHVLAGQEIETFGAVARFLHVYLVTPESRQIDEAAGLTGRRVGVTPGTAADFFLSRYLELRGLHRDDVIVVPVEPGAMQAALTSGEVDAVAVWSPVAQSLQAASDEPVTLIPLQDEQPGFWCLLAAGDWLDGHEEETESLLAALARAAAYAGEEPEEASEIVRSVLGEDRESFAVTWPQYEFDLFLNDSLVAALEDESRWLMAEGLAPVTSIPDFYDSIREGALAVVNPGAVDLAW